MRPVPILMYHQVDPIPLPSFGKYTVAPSAFAAQIGWLRRAGYTSIDFAQLLEGRSGHRRLPPRPVVITFDDGYAEALRHAPPILEAHGYTATFFVVAGLIGEAAAWLPPLGGPPPRLATGSAIRALHGRGFGIGAHSMSHARLTDLDDAECWHELSEGRRKLEELVGAPVRQLAYPFGAEDDRVRTLAANAGYLLACSVRIGLSNRNDDLMALHRVPIDGREGLWNFGCRVRSGWSCRERVGRAVRFPVPSRR